MQIPIKNKIPKIISGIAITTSLIAIGFFLFSSFWFWVSLELIAALIVAIGCSGEWWLHHHPSGKKKKDKEEHHKLESLFIAMVSLGVIMELFALGHSIREGVKLEGEVSKANERAATNELQVALIETTNALLIADNLLLRSNVVALEWQIDDASKKITKNDPLNQPILSVKAYGMLLIRRYAQWNNFGNMMRNNGAINVEFRIPSIPGVAAWLDLGTSARAIKDHWGVELFSDNVSPSIDTVGNEEFLRLDLYFGESNSPAFLYKQFNDPPLTTVDSDTLGLWLPMPCEIVSGKVDLIINGTIQKQFQIPKQITYNVIATSVMTNGTFITLKLPFERKK